MEDVHFHHDSAVMLPDYESCDPLPDAPDEERITALTVMSAFYLHASKHPEQKILITGHADTSGSASYNVQLTEMRANNVWYALSGNRQAWVKSSEQKHKVEDYQQILKWISRVRGWDCDPGKVDNQLKAFQQRYNEEFEAEIAEDGIVGAQTWGAFFDIYMEELKKILKTDDAGLVSYRSGLHFLDASKKTVGCGESFPIDPSRGDEYRSMADRRVELLFFDPGEEPELACHPGLHICDPKKCEIYDPKKYCFKHLPVDPILYTRTWIEIVLVDEADRPIPNALYQVKLPNGMVIEDKLDENGRARLERVIAGTCRITFPELDADAWERIAA
jgi:hypothetical protein